MFFYNTTFFQGQKTGVLVHKAIYYILDEKVIDQVITFEYDFLTQILK